MDFVAFVRQRLEELAIGQRDLAAAADVTESYISQLLSRRKLPPLPNRTDLYDKMSGFLGVPRAELARLAALQHHQALDRTWRAEPAPLFGPMRELVLRKCRPATREAMRAVFEQQPFGNVERLVTRTLIESIRQEASDHARDEKWLQAISADSGPSYRKMRVRLIDLLDSDPSASMGDFSYFIGPLIRFWDFDELQFLLTVQLTTGSTREFRFQEITKDVRPADTAGLRVFLRDATLSGGAAADEIKFLRSIRFAGNEHPTALFYYRTLQNLRDPLNFRADEAQR
ncbi:MAG TPA: helix-turn-helix transcriptional regulator [Thermoanaerobaculia bacterium]|nr:helix-turn-helix transcriptional regulator [Thermoanaerobaculia bacterium]